jgi:hypothetical protein
MFLRVYLFSHKISNFVLFIEKIYKSVKRTKNKIYNKVKKNVIIYFMFIFKNIRNNSCVILSDHVTVMYRSMPRSFCMIHRDMTILIVT